MGKRVARGQLTDQQLMDVKRVPLQRTATFLSAALLFSSATAPVLAQAAESESASTEEAITNFEGVGTSKNEIELHTYTSTDVHTEANESSTTDSAVTDQETDDSTSIKLADDASDAEEDLAETSEDIQPVEGETSVGEATSSSPDVLDHIESNELVGIAPMSGTSSRSTTSQAGFLAEMAPQCRDVATANDLYASVMIAQAILETGWGTSSLSRSPYHNLFGIKGSYNGQSVTMPTKEVINGNWVTVQAAFRAYPSYKESFADNAYILRNSKLASGAYRYSGAWKSNTSSYKDATAWLQGRYATDTSYASKLNTIISANNLTQYDTPDSGNGSNNSGTPSDPGTTPAPTPAEGTYYTVVAGDTLWRISQRYGVSVANIKQWNNLSSDTIYVGQRLLVSADSSSSSSSTSTGTNDQSGSNGSTQSGSYRVVSGDTLWKISRKYGVSVTDLKQWNNLISDVIYVGQQLTIKGTSANDGGSSSSSTGNSGQTQNSGTTSGAHIVQRGDTLWSIAKKYSMSVNDLKAKNNLTSDLIYVGQRLTVSGSGSQSSASSTPSVSQGNSVSASGTYKVASGDTLWRIAQKNGMSVNDLKSLNNLKSDFIFVGQTLKIAKTSSTQTNTSTSNQTKHTVQKGDTLWSIAKKYGISVQQLKQQNNLSSDIIRIGQQLRIK